VQTRFNRTSRNVEDVPDARVGLDVFAMLGRSLGKGIPTKFDAGSLKKAHQYVLFNCSAVRPYIE
jgi:hypothetical protein